MAEYIEREALIHRFMTKRQYLTKDLVLDAVYEIGQIPAADVAPVRRGHWVDMQQDDQTEGMWRCSCCGDDRYFYEEPPSEYEFKFCPNCGARCVSED